MESAHPYCNRGEIQSMQKDMKTISITYNIHQHYQPEKLLEEYRRVQENMWNGIQRMHA